MANTAFRFVPRNDAAKKPGRKPKHEQIDEVAWIAAGAFLSATASAARELLMQEQRISVLRLVVEHSPHESVRSRARARLRLLDPVPVERQPEPALNQMPLWKCGNADCSHIGPPDDFGFRRMYKGGPIRKQSQCRDCRSKAAKKTREKKAMEKKLAGLTPEARAALEWAEEMNEPTNITG